jgi:hypothetical protein
MLRLYPEESLTAFLWEIGLGLASDASTRPSARRNLALLARSQPRQALNLTTLDHR